MLRSEQSETSSLMSPTLTASDRGTTSSISSRSPRSEVSGDGATIGRSLLVRGEVSGSEPLYIEGRVEGAINLPTNRVTIGRNGQVDATIVAREIVVMGKVRGNCQATDRVEIRGEASLTGDVIAARISIEDGAFFKGGIELRRAASGSDLPRHERQKHLIAVEGSRLATLYDAQAEEEISQGRFETLNDESDLEDLLPKWRSTSPALAHSRTA
jgi:cytoskeletal protein CcmA (bactofilin family)